MTFRLTLDPVEVTATTVAGTVSETLVMLTSPAFDALFYEEGDEYDEKGDLRDKSEMGTIMQAVVDPVAGNIPKGPTAVTFIHNNLGEFDGVLTLRIVAFNPTKEVSS